MAHKGAAYLHLLKALEYLLDKVSESYWRDWLREDIALWKNKNDMSHHLSAYGGMGSLNDHWISARNGHAITDLQESWGNRLLRLFRDLCFQSAHASQKEKNIGIMIGKGPFTIVGLFFETANSKMLVLAKYLNG
jgi:hypothetical protein